MKLTLRQNFWFLLGLSSWALFTTLLTRQRFQHSGDLINITHEAALHAVIPSLLLVLIPSFTLSRLYRCLPLKTTKSEWAMWGTGLMISFILAWTLRDYYFY
jgi:uncharacterized BrkB/YihY/UPF0761 family membrane protein